MFLFFLILLELLSEIHFTLLNLDFLGKLLMGILSGLHALLLACSTG